MFDNKNIDTSVVLEYWKIVHFSLLIWGLLKSSKWFSLFQFALHVSRQNINFSTKLYEINRFHLLFSSPRHMRALSASDGAENDCQKAHHNLGAPERIHEKLQGAYQQKADNTQKNGRSSPCLMLYAFQCEKWRALHWYAAPRLVQ